VGDAIGHVESLVFVQLTRTALAVLVDVLAFFVRSCDHAALAAEHLFLRKQLAFYVERKKGPDGLLIPLGSHWPD